MPTDEVIEAPEPPEPVTKFITAYVVDNSGLTLQVKQVAGVVTDQDPGVFQVRRPGEITQYAYSQEIVERSEDAEIIQKVWFPTPTEAVKYARSKAAERRRKLREQLDALPDARDHAYVTPATTLD